MTNNAILFFMTSPRARVGVSRYFRLNEGTTDGYETGARLIPDPGLHFDVEFQILGAADGNGTIAAQSTASASSGREFMLFTVSNTLRIRVGGTSNTFTTPTSAGVWRLIFNGSTAELFKGGISVESLALSIGVASEPSATFTIGMRHNGTNSSYGFHYAGVIGNVVIRSSLGAIVNNYPINEPSGPTAFDTAGGDNAAIVSGLDTDRGRFTEQPTLWKGENLTVPPWDSVDQELLKA